MLCNAVLPDSCCSLILEVQGVSAREHSIARSSQLFATSSKDSEYSTQACHHTLQCCMPPRQNDSACLSARLSPE
eukprot:1158711-Pelagomonas_calceolata.AAC.2